MERSPCLKAPKVKNTPDVIGSAVKIMHQRQSPLQTLAAAMLNDSERELLDRLAAEGKATRLTLSELEAAKSLDAEGLIFMIRSSLDATIMPKGRHLLAEFERKPKRNNPPFGFTS
jgi:hypothetical protein